MQSERTSGGFAASHWRGYRLGAGSGFGGRGLGGGVASQGEGGGGAAPPDGEAPWGVDGGGIIAEQTPKSW